MLEQITAVYACNLRNHLVIGEGDTVVLKAIAPPPISEFREMIQKAREAAYEAGMTPEYVDKAISEVRSETADRV